MGISDDIKPKRSHRPAQKDTFEDDFDYGHLDDIEYIDRPDISSVEKREKLEDEFFAGQKKKKVEYRIPPEPKADEETEKKPKTGKVIILILLLIFAFLLVYENFNAIKKLINEKILHKNTTVENNEASTSAKSDDYYVSSQDNKATESQSGTSNTTATNPSTPATTTATISKESILIKILNGNGISKSADKLKAELVSLGFKISRVGNASNFNYTDTIIYYKTGKESEAGLIESSIKSHPVLKEKNDTITGSYDAVIVLGAK